MIKIILDNTIKFYVDGDEHSDLLELIDEYVQENKKDFIIYDYEMLKLDYDDTEIDENFIPINGGEYYVDNISYIDINIDVTFKIEYMCQNEDDYENNEHCESDFEYITAKSVEDVKELFEKKIKSDIEKNVNQLIDFNEYGDGYKFEYFDINNIEKIDYITIKNIEILDKF